MKRMGVWVVGMWVAAAGVAGAQQPFPPFEVDQVKVDKAINAGIAYLKKNNSAHLKMFEHVKKEMSNRELVLYTYVHAGVPENDPAFTELFESMLQAKLEATYCVSLQAMILEDVQRVKYQNRIWQCAQFLVDNQNPQGYWGYGDPSIFVEDIPTGTPRKDVSSGGGSVKKFDSLPPPGVKAKPPVKNKVRVEKKRDGSGHDNSNSQYAALGMRACHDAGIIFPPAVIDKAIEWWRKSQKDDKLPEEPLIEGGVDGPEKPKGGGTVAMSRSQKMASPQGWCYGDHDHKAYGSMSAGAVGSLCIFLYIKDNDEGKKRTWKNDKDVWQGLQWLAKNFSVTYNPGPYEHGNMEENSQHQYYYYLYALERTGMLYGTEIMGTHKWYPEGAKVLCDIQKGDGSWGGGTVDTCFAILFLKRATRPLDVATHSAGSMK
ncbi:MAG TPA: hypothetical protein VEJ18_02050 [Planctomycetota bacterium]|nr:hypothetical protein [Planctomycetota bacterium]